MESDSISENTHNLLGKNDGQNPANSAVLPPMPDAEAIQSWMVAKLAEAVQVDPDALDFQAPFTSYGLESIVVFSLAGELAEWLGRDLPATLLWEYPTIEQLAAHLSTESSTRSLSPMSHIDSDSMAEGRL